MINYLCTLTLTDNLAYLRFSAVLHWTHVDCFFQHCVVLLCLRPLIGGGLSDAFV